MTKADFVSLVATKHGCTKVEANAIIKTFTESIVEVVKAKDSINLVGFGTFRSVEVAKKSGFVPSSDKRYTKEAHTAYKFKFSKAV